MNRARILAAIISVYVIFAVLLNSVGTVILQSITSFHVDKPHAALLEGFKDLSIAAASFFVALMLPRLGYRRGAALGLIAVAAACVVIAKVGRFWALELLFATTGVGFAIAKISVYTTIGLVTDTREAHASLTSLVEGLFMVGVLSSYWLFSAFIDPARPASLVWLNTYWWLAGACVVAAALQLTAPLDESPARRPDARFRDLVLSMPRLLGYIFVLAFLVCAFLDVLVEQSFGTWLPTFNREVLRLPTALSIQVASLYAAGLAIGRLVAGVLLRRLPWFVLLSLSLVGAAALVLLVLPLASPSHVGGNAGGWRDLPLAALLLPLVGVLLAPVYPTICSVVLSSLPRDRHAGMTGLIVIFSALGGTLGSLITGRVFAAADGRMAFLAVLAPMTALIAALFGFKRCLDTQARERLDAHA